MKSLYVELNDVADAHLAAIRGYAQPGISRRWRDEEVLRLTSRTAAVVRWMTISRA